MELSKEIEQKILVDIIDIKKDKALGVGADSITNQVNRKSLPNEQFRAPLDLNN